MSDRPTEDDADRDGRPEPASAFPRPFGEYTLVRELGRGAMGVVYEAVHRPLGRTVALKVFRVGDDADSAELERFRREAQACAQMRHPNIVAVYDAGQVDDQPYYSMALLRGRSLQDLAVAHSLPPILELLHGFADVADALAALHEVGIVHRDVKPASILVADDGAMVLADFGLARTAQSERATASSQTLGTPLYMSPEQILGNASEIDGRSDVYGLGATMYEVLTGRPVFQIDGAASALRLILREEPQAPRVLRPGLPTTVERIILKCLEKSKDDRYATAAALRDELRGVAGDRRNLRRRDSVFRRGLRGVVRFAPAISAGVVVGAVGAWFWTHRDATLHVASLPVAQVTIDDAPQGDTPVVARLAPGSHVVTLEQAGFYPHTEPVDLEPGARLELRRVLIAQAGDDPRALARIGDDLGVDMASNAPLTPEPRSSAEPVRILWPRGEVRVEDLGTWRIEISPDFAESGRLEFRRVGKAVVEVAFAPTNLVTELAIPDAVRAGLQPGERVTWGFVPRLGEPVMGEFTVTQKDLSDRFDRIAQRTKDQPKTTAPHLRAQVLLDEGLNLAAYREATALTEIQPRDRLAWLVAQHALDRLYLRGTRPWRDACDGVANSPEPRPAMRPDGGKSSQPK